MNAFFFQMLYDNPTLETRLMFGKDYPGVDREDATGWTDGKGLKVRGILEPIDLSTVIFLQDDEFGVRPIPQVDPHQYALISEFEGNSLQGQSLVAIEAARGGALSARVTSLRAALRNEQE